MHEQSEQSVDSAVRSRDQADGILAEHETLVLLARNSYTDEVSNVEANALFAFGGSATSFI
jgi:hypothetical protein